MRMNCCVLVFFFFLHMVHLYLLHWNIGMELKQIVWNTCLTFCWNKQLYEVVSESWKGLGLTHLPKSDQMTNLEIFFFFFKGFLIGLITLQHLLKYTNNVTNLHTYTHNVQFILYAPTLTVFTVFAYHIYKINILKYFTKK